jgi:gamma-glutamylcyclotransferase (GGCT)/AIG2-like uncharacterized protein YtfP
VELCAARAIPFQAVGGLAVRAWGGQRDLVDLDFYVPDAALPVLAEFPGWRVRGPERIHGDRWDRAVALLDLDGCRVEFGGADTARYRDHRTGTWCSAAIGFDRGVTRMVFGEAIPVMPKDELVSYKTVLDRDVDLVDLHALAGAGGPVETRLATYGTLQLGEANHHVIEKVRGVWERGTTRGELHDLGWGMTFGFPALVWHPDGAPVAVQLLTSPALPQHWGRLDAFEGDAYRRIVAPVDCGGNRVLANIYALRWPT